MKIYTKTGDLGGTALIGGVRVSKASTQLDTYGIIDELNAHTGLALELLKAASVNAEQASQRDAMVQQLLDVQNQLFTVGSILATEVTCWEKQWSNNNLDSWTRELELQIDSYSAELPPWRGFILPSGSKGAAQLHICRTVCRRAERKLCQFAQENDLKNDVFNHLLQFANRLSDFYFILARKELQLENISEIIWKSGR